MDRISILNGDGEYIYMNKAHADVFEYDADELLGSTWQRLYDDDEIARIEQEIFPVLEREGEWRGETVGKRRDGSSVYQELTLSLLDDGKLICTNRDITKRREREQELQMVREQFEQFAGNVQDAFFLLPTDYSETKYVNPAVETIYRISPEETYDDPTAWLRHVHTDDKDELLKSLETQQDGTVEWPIEQEFRVNHPSGVRWVQARLDVITNENGDPFRLTGVTTDITRRIERKQQLEQQTEELEHLASKYESQYQTLFEEPPVMTVLTRSEDDRPIIEDYNSQFVETFGYDADILIGSELTEFYAPESEEKLQLGGYIRSINGQFTREKRDLVADDGEVVETLLRSVPHRTAEFTVSVIER